MFCDAVYESLLWLAARMFWCWCLYILDIEIKATYQWNDMNGATKRYCYLHRTGHTRQKTFLASSNLGMDCFLKLICARHAWLTASSTSNTQGKYIKICSLPSPALPPPTASFRCKHYTLSINYYIYSHILTKVWDTKKNRLTYLNRFINRAEEPEHLKRKHYRGNK